MEDAPYGRAWWLEKEDPNGWEGDAIKDDPAADRIFQRQLKRNRELAEELYSALHHPEPEDATMDTTPDTKLAAWQAAAPAHWQRPFLVLVPAAGGRTWPIGSFDTEAEAIACGVDYATRNRTNCGSATVHHATTGRRWGIAQSGIVTPPQ